MPDYAPKVCCSEVVGGEVYIVAHFSGTDSSYYEALGDVRIQPSRVERTAGASSGGRVWVTEVSRPMRVILSFINRCDTNPMRLYCERCQIGITVFEKSRGFMHQFNDCLIVGAPEVNLSTGEISGIEIVTDDYSVGWIGEMAGGSPCVNFGNLSTPEDTGPYGAGAANAGTPSSPLG